MNTTPTGAAPPYVGPPRHTPAPKLGDPRFHILKSDGGSETNLDWGRSGEHYSSVSPNGDRYLIAEVRDGCRYFRHHNEFVSVEDALLEKLEWLNECEATTESGEWHCIGSFHTLGAAAAAMRTIRKSF